MTQYHTKSFYTNTVSEPRDEAIDLWLRQFCTPGYGSQVVGYVSIKDSITITVKTWKIVDPLLGLLGQPRSTPDVSQPEAWKEPTIDIEKGAGEEST